LSVDEDSKFLLEICIIVLMKDWQLLNLKNAATSTPEQEALGETLQQKRYL
jgi:hypothetical protein